MPATAQTDVTSKATVFAGPYAANVVRVIDGDTLEVSVALWPGLRAEYAVRVRGIDAPELFRPDCEREFNAAKSAKDQVEKFYPSGLEIQLREVSYDAFSGRVVADVRRWVSDRWRPLSMELLDRQLAIEWTPNQSAFNWCIE